MHSLAPVCNATTTGFIALALINSTISTISTTRHAKRIYSTVVSHSGTQSPGVHSSAPRQPSSGSLALHWGNSEVAAYLTSHLTEFHRRVCEKLEYVVAQRRAHNLSQAGKSKMGTISPVRDFALTKYAYPDPSLNRRLSSTSPSPPAGSQKLKAGEVISLIPAQDGNHSYFKLEKDDDFSWWEAPTPDHLIKN